MIGEDEHTILVPKEKLTCIEPFRAALTGPWRESQGNRITLIEDDVETWQKAIERLMGQEILPRGVPIRIVDLTGNPIEYHRGSHQQMGDWIFPEATSAQFSNLVKLFKLANKYLWTELQEECLEAIIHFPIGPEAFAILVAIPQELYTVSQAGDPSSRYEVAGLSNIIHYAMKYHANRYEELHDHAFDLHTAHSHLLEQRSKLYDPLDDFMKANMTSQAWAVYKGLAEQRTEKAIDMRLNIDARRWLCEDDRQGVLVKNWDMFEAVSHCLDDETMATMPYGEGTDAEIRWYSEKFHNLFPGQRVFEAVIGDVIVRIRSSLVESPGRPDLSYISGLNIRTQERGWYPRSWVRLLERRSKKHCNNDSVFCHEDNTCLLARWR